MKQAKSPRSDAPTLDFRDAHAGASPLTVMAFRSLLDRQPAYEAIVLATQGRRAL